MPMWHSGAYIAASLRKLYARIEGWWAGLSERHRKRIQEIGLTLVAAGIAIALLISMLTGEVQ